MDENCIESIIIFLFVCMKIVNELNKESRKIISKKVGLNQLRWNDDVSCLKGYKCVFWCFIR